MGLSAKGTYLKQQLQDKLIHKHYMRRHGEDMQEIRKRRWGARPAADSATK